MRKFFIGGMVILASATLVPSCLKQKDETGNGPKARIAIVNAALDSEPVTLLLDGEKLNPEPIGFGSASGTVADACLNARPGVRSTAWQIGSFVPEEKRFLNWKPGAYYTLIHFDTAFNNQFPWIILEDQAVPADTIAKARFINCVAGADSISIWLVQPGDTVQLARRQAYLGVSGTAAATFDASVKPGTWRYEMFSAGNELLAEGEIEFSARGLYSFISVGETGGVGEKKPGVLVLNYQVN